MDYTALLRDLQAAGDEEMAAFLLQQMQYNGDSARLLNVQGSRKPLSMPLEQQKRPTSGRAVPVHKRRPLSPLRPCWMPVSPKRWAPPAARVVQATDPFQELRSAFSASGSTMSPISVPEVVDAMFKKFDVDGERPLSLDEFCNALVEVGVPRYITSIIFFMSGRSCDGRIDKYEFAAMCERSPKPLISSMSQSLPTLHGIAAQVAGEDLFLHQLYYRSSQIGGSHLGAFFTDQSGAMFYVRFLGLPSVCNDDATNRRIFNDLRVNPHQVYPTIQQSSHEKFQTMSEVLVSRLYGMVGVTARCVRFVFVKGSDIVGLWSRVVEYDDIGIDEMPGLPGLKEGFAADAWLANWDVIGNGSPAELNTKRTNDGCAFRMGFEGCLQFRPRGGDKADVGKSIKADDVPEVAKLRRDNQAFSDVEDSDIAAGVAKIVAGATDSAIRDVVDSTLGIRCGSTADILIERKRTLSKTFSSSAVNLPEVVDRMFQQFDVNGDGRLSLEELCNALAHGGVPRYMASIIFFMNDRNCDGRIDKYEFARMYENAPKPLRSCMTQSMSTLHEIAARVAGEDLFLHQLTFLSSQTGGSHLGAFFKDTSGDRFYVKFPGLTSVCNDDVKSQRAFNELMSNSHYVEDTRQSSEDKRQTMSEVLVSKLYGMVGVEACRVRFVFVMGSDIVGLWSRVVEYDDIDVDEMPGLPGLKEGFAADAWLANWDVIGNGSPAELNTKRTKDGRAFRLDFGGCLQYRARGGNKAEVGQPFTADAVPEIVSLRRYNHVFSDVEDSDIAAGVAKIVAGATDSAIRDVVESTLTGCGEIADILIGRKHVLTNEFSLAVRTLRLVDQGDSGHSFSSSPAGRCEYGGLGSSFASEKYRTSSPSSFSQRSQGEGQHSPNRGQILGPSRGILSPSGLKPRVRSPTRMERPVTEFVWGSGQSLDDRGTRASSPLHGGRDNGFHPTSLPNWESQPGWRPPGKSMSRASFLGQPRAAGAHFAGDDPLAGTSRAGGWQNDSSRAPQSTYVAQRALHMSDAEGSTGLYMGPASRGKANGIGKMRYDIDGSVFIGDFVNGNMLTGSLYSQSGEAQSTMNSGRWTRTLHYDILASFPWSGDINTCFS